MAQYRNYLIKKYHETELEDLPSAPSDALRGLSKNDANLLKESFHVESIADLSRLKYVDWAEEIIEWANTHPEDLPEIFENKLIKQYEKKPGKLLAKAPAYALQGLSKPDAERMKTAFNIKSMQDMAELKFVHIAREICSLSQQAQVSAPVEQAPAPLSDHQKTEKERMPWFWIIILSLLLGLTIYLSICYLKSYDKTQETAALQNGITENTLVPQTEQIPDDNEMEDIYSEAMELNEEDENALESGANKEPEEIPTEDMGDTDSVYSVVPGDTLASIAYKKLGSYQKSGYLLNLNRDVIKNPNIIFPGQKLKLK